MLIEKERIIKDKFTCSINVDSTDKHSNVYIIKNFESSNIANPILYFENDKTLEVTFKSSLDKIYNYIDVPELEIKKILDNDTFESEFKSSFGKYLAYIKKNYKVKMINVIIKSDND